MEILEHKHTLCYNCDQWDTFKIKIDDEIIVLTAKQIFQLVCFAEKKDCITEIDDDWYIKCRNIWNF